MGTTLCSKWRLDAILGIGGMATVYAATHRNRARVAIKMLHPEHSVDDQIRAKFLREGYVANTIRHAGAVSVIDDDTTEDGVAFLVMELLTGESLGQRMKRHRGRLAPREALLITEQLLDVLCAAHAKGVVHRDIKPENVFITATGQLKVLDFGIARLRVEKGTSSIASGIFAGTPGFAPPEQARGRTSEVDARSDLYAVGATLFAMLTGRLVHEGETATERLALTIGLPAPSIVNIAPDLPLPIAALVDRALRYDKRDRWPNAKAMLSAVRAALPAATGGESQSEQPSTLTMPPSVLRRLLDDCRSSIIGPTPNSTVRFTGSSHRRALRKKWQAPLIAGFVAAGIAGSVFAVTTSLRTHAVDVLEAGTPAPVVQNAVDAAAGTNATKAGKDTAPAKGPDAALAPSSSGRSELPAGPVAAVAPLERQNVAIARPLPAASARVEEASPPQPVSKVEPEPPPAQAAPVARTEPVPTAPPQPASHPVSEPAPASSAKPSPVTLFARRR